MSTGISTGGALGGLTSTGQQETQPFANNTEDSDSSGSITDGLGGGGVGKNQFLEILMAQLQNQNPLDPQKSGKFVDQMASLTSLEQMTQISNSMKSFQQSQKSQQFMTLLGKNVEVKTSEGNTVTGEVESVRFTDDGSSVLVDGEDIGTEEISAISTVDNTEETS